ncbi:MAG: methylmalonyl-CoA epimerase [Candidatus Krumholzibacteriia bacterium]|jgi:methylmalonyl-CoA epimerase
MSYIEFKVIPLYFTKEKVLSAPMPNTEYLLPPGTAGAVDHIGIAVRDLDEGIALYSGLLGLELERTEVVPQENIRVAFLKMGRESAVGHVELLAPLSDEGNIARFIAKHGPGLHHIALAATNIEEVMERCRAAGMRLLDETPREGAGGKKIVFMHPKSGGGVLIEICSE